MFAVSWWSVFIITDNDGISALEMSSWFVIPILLAQDISGTKPSKIVKTRIRFRLKIWLGLGRNLVRIRLRIWLGLG